WKKTPLDNPTKGKLAKITASLDGMDCYEFVANYLMQGLPGYAKLADIFAYLEEERAVGLLFVGRYHLNFAHVQAALVHADAIAGFAHFYLNATVGVQRSVFRDKLYEFLPVFLKFHQSRYPDLLADFRQDIFRQITQPDGSSPERVYGAAIAIDYRPAVHYIESALEKYKTLQEWTSAFKYLEYQDNQGAVGVMARFIAGREEADAKYETDLALKVLLRMKARGAKEALDFYCKSKNLYVRGAAFRAYFSIERKGTGEFEKVMDYFNLPKADFRHKRLLLFQLYKINPALGAQVEASVDQLTSADFQELVRRQKSRNMPAPPKKTEAETPEKAPTK
ncbi:MAG: hypothetical protein AAF517_20875, partial [Planctomycetota bacterium]